MDIQFILIFILAILTVNLVVVGVYLVLVLKDTREAVKKFNSIIGRLDSVTSIVSNPITTILGLVNGVVDGIKVAKSIKSIRDVPEEEEEEE